MEKFLVTFHHVNGRSLGHPCRAGIWPDPSDGREFQVDAESEEAAKDEGDRLLALALKDYSHERCPCGRSVSLTNSWWESVSATVTPATD